MQTQTTLMPDAVAQSCGLSTGRQRQEHWEVQDHPQLTRSSGIAWAAWGLVSKQEGMKAKERLFGKSK